MINIVKNSNDSFKVTFDDQQFYLQDGVILLPMNSLVLVIDSSDIATFKKVDNGDVFFSSLISEVEFNGESVTKSTIYDKFAETCTAPAGADPAKQITSVELEDGGTKLVLENFSGGTVASADTTMFVADSYVKDAYTSGTTLYLVIDTISGDTLVEVDMEDVLDQYYTISETDTLLAEKMDLSDWQSAEEAIAHSLSDLNTDVQSVSGSLVNYATTATTNALSGAIDGLSDGLSAYTLQSDFESMERVTAEALYRISGDCVAISGAVENMDLSDYATTGQMATLSGQVTANTAAISNKQNTLTAGNNITISADTISSDQVVKCTQAEYDALVQGGTVDPDKLYVITDAPSADLSNYTLTSTTAALASKVNTISGDVATKQDQLTAGSGITIDANNVISASADLSNYYDKSAIDNAEQATSAALNDLNIRVNTVSGAVENLDLSDYATTASVNTALADKLDTSAFTSAEQAIAVSINQLNSDITTLSGDVQNIDLTPYATTAITNTLSGDIATLSGQVASKAEIVRMTTQEYQTSSGTVQSNQLVIITDAQAVDMNDYYTKSEIDQMIGQINQRLTALNG